MPAAEATPVACTLDGSALGARLAWIRSLAEHKLLSHRLDGGTLRLTYRADAADELLRIVDLERSCCAFLDFALETNANEAIMTITSPAGNEADARRLLAQFLPDVRAVTSARGCKGACG